MLWIDPRKGSQEFLEGELRKVFSAFSIPVEREQMDYGDFRILGNILNKDGEDDVGVIGIERKSLNDFITCMSDSRFIGHQLVGMRETYDFTFVVLEGVFRPDNDGYVVTPIKRNGHMEWRRVYQGNKTVLYSALSRHIFTLSLRAGVQMLHTGSRLHTAFEVANLYRWFNDKKFSEHTSHIGFYDPASILRVKSSPVRRVAMQIDGVGFEKSGYIEKEFTSIYEMATAREDRWANIRWESGKGRNMSLGKATAMKIVRWFRGGKDRLKEEERSGE